MELHSVCRVSQLLKLITDAELLLTVALNCCLQILLALAALFAVVVAQPIGNGQEDSLLTERVHDLEVAENHMAKMEKKQAKQVALYKRRVLRLTVLTQIGAAVQAQAQAEALAAAQAQAGAQYPSAIPPAIPPQYPPVAPPQLPPASLGVAPPQFPPASLGEAPPQFPPASFGVAPPQFPPASLPQQGSWK